MKQKHTTKITTKKSQIITIDTATVPVVINTSKKTGENKTVLKSTTKVSSAQRAHGECTQRAEM
jgi:hypothetical protein